MLTFLICVMFHAFKILNYKTINYVIMNPFKLPISEINDSPSVATFQPIDPNSVRARMQVKDDSSMPTNGHTLDSLRDFAEISRHDKIDQVGLATKALSESVTKYAKSDTARSFQSWLLKQSQQAKKPKN